MRARRGWCLSLFSKFSSPGARGLRCAFRSFPEKAARRLLKRVTGSFALFRAETSALRVAAPLRARLPPQQRRAQRLAAPGTRGAGGTGHGAVPKPPESRGNQPRTSPRGPASPRFNGGSEARPRGGGRPYPLPPASKPGPAAEGRTDAAGPPLPRLANFRPRDSGGGRSRGRGRATDGRSRDRQRAPGAGPAARPGFAPRPAPAATQGCRPLACADRLRASHSRRAVPVTALPRPGSNCRGKGAPRHR